MYVTAACEQCDWHFKTAQRGFAARSAITIGEWQVSNVGNKVTNYTRKCEHQLFSVRELYIESIG